MYALNKRRSDKMTVKSIPHIFIQMNVYILCGFVSRKY